MALRTVWLQLEETLDPLALLVREFSSKKPALNNLAHFSIEDECFLEGLLSRTWQAWNTFCRDCVVESCMGTVDASGNPVHGLPHALTEAHVAGAAIRAKRCPRDPVWGTPNDDRRAEPTWGDLDSLDRILQLLSPANSRTMLAAFSAGHQAARTLQVIRNGTSHVHPQNMKEIRNLQSYYISFPIGHPTHSLFWIERRSSDFLITNTMEDLKLSGLAAVS